jgi:polyhydroxybutyrate depolymerase
MPAGRSPRLVLLAGLAAALVGVGALSAFGGAAPAPMRHVAPAVAAASACSARPGRSERIAVAVEGQGTRSALVHVPHGRRGGLPLIVALHGASANGAFMERYSGLSRLGDRQGFAVVYPDAAGSRWRIGTGEGSADVQFLDALLDRVLAGGCFDRRRVSVVGVSNGAGMAARFACAGDDRLAGLVAVAGSYGNLPECDADRPVSVLEIHGTDDRVVPYDGTPQNPRASVARWLEDWVERDTCRRVPRRTHLRRGVLRLDWAPCRGGTSVAHIRIAGGKHAWPGAEPPDPGPQRGVSASREAWDFLRGRRLSPLPGEHDDG